MHEYSVHDAEDRKDHEAHQDPVSDSCGLTRGYGDERIHDQCSDYADRGANHMTVLNNALTYNPDDVKLGSQKARRRAFRSWSFVRESRSMRANDAMFYSRHRL